jgi:acetyl-CoA carboxylase biotin carboxyl carrier protein
MIDIRKLKELVRLMVENELSELDLRDQEETVTIRRGSDGVPAVTGQPYMYGAPPAPAAAPASAPSSGGGGGDSGSAPSDEGLIAIESPMVGTFYSRPDPDTDAFTSVGASVSADSVVCLVEAMKVFNEIKAGSSGTIAKICVNDGDAVEFGQPLFMIKPN